MRELSKLVDMILVVGATNSSNSNRLREIGDANIRRDAVRFRKLLRQLPQTFFAPRDEQQIVISRGQLARAADRREVGAASLSF